MRILSFKEIKWDKNYIIWLIVAFLLAIICGIVLFKIADIGTFFADYAQVYVVCVFEFDNGKLLLSHLLSELCYLYAFFAIAYFTKFKVLTAIILFFRTLICVFYCAVMFSVLGFGGVMAALIIYIPTFIESVLFCYFVAETCRIVSKNYVYFWPMTLALLNCVFLLIMLNVVFRLLIVIV